MTRYRCVVRLWSLNHETNLIFFSNKFITMKAKIFVNDDFVNDFLNTLSQFIDENKETRNDWDDDTDENEIEKDDFVEENELESRVSNIEDLLEKIADKLGIDQDEDDYDDDEDEFDDDEEAEDATFEDFDKRHVYGLNNFLRHYDFFNPNPLPRWDVCENGNQEDQFKRFGAGFEIDEPRWEDYDDREEFEDDHAAYDRFVDAGEDCVARGLEKPEGVEIQKVNAIRKRIDEVPPMNIELIGETNWW